MDSDITSMGDFLNTWLPEQFNKNIPPVIDKAEQTIDSAHNQIRSSLKDSVITARMAVVKAHTNVMDSLAESLGSIESRIDSVHKKILNSIDLQLLPLEGKTSMTGIILPPIVTVPVVTTDDNLGLRCTCDVHKVMEPYLREQYKYIYRKLDHTYVVCPAPIENVIDLQIYFPFYIALQWWQAELICHLMNDCKWSVELFQTYAECIKHVELYQGEPGVIMGNLCKNASYYLSALCTELGV